MLPQTSPHPTTAIPKKGTPVAVMMVTTTGHAAPIRVTGTAKTVMMITAVSEAPTVSTGLATTPAAAGKKMSRRNVQNEVVAFSDVDADADVDTDTDTDGDNLDAVRKVNKQLKGL